jgi:transducin (beta)-like 1
MDSDSALWSLTGHTKEVYAVRWSPTSLPSATSPSATSPLVSTAPKIVVSASFDSTIRLWDVMNGSCYRVLENHSDHVYSVAFSPDGYYLASGSSDCSMVIWRVKDGAVVKIHKMNDKIYQVGWGVKGDKVSLCCSDGSVRYFSLVPCFFYQIYMYL